MGVSRALEGTLLRVLIRRIVIICCLYWGPLFWETAMQKTKAPYEALYTASLQKQYSSGDS